MKNILVTGGAGFIGSNFIEYLLNKEEASIINFDKLTYAGSLDNLKTVENHKNYLFIKGDIYDRLHLERVFSEHHITDVIHFAAESHVDNSITNPETFINTNINGTFNLLDVAYRFWMNGPKDIKKSFEKSRFLHISTDEVYGSLGKEGFFTEETPYAPNSPYSASKAASDFLVRSYYHTYGMNVITTNCSNNYGPNQHDEKLIPTIIRKALNNEAIPIYGDGQNVRDWLYVKDHCGGILLAFKKGKAGETYNIGGNNEETNLQIANKICSILSQKIPKKSPYSKQITFVNDRPGHDFRYAIDATKIQSELGWVPKETFNTGIEKTIDWYIKKYKNS